MNPKDEELLQRFQQDVKRIMRFFNQELENQFSAYRLYEDIFKKSAAKFPLDIRKKLEDGIANGNLTTPLKNGLLSISSEGEENNSVFTFFHHNMAKNLQGREIHSKGEMGEKFKKFHGTSGNYSENIEGWWLVKPQFYAKGDSLYLLHIFPYSAYDFPERLKDTDLWSDYDGLSFYYATIYSNHRNSVSFSKEAGDKPFPWTSGKGWEGNTDFVRLGQTVKEITRPRTHGLLNWWGKIED